jgi:hypothetical protein
MKNSVNIILVVFVLVVLGCTCTSKDGFQVKEAEKPEKEESKAIDKPAKNAPDGDSDLIKSDDKKDSSDSKDATSDSKDDHSKRDTDIDERDITIPSMSKFNQIKNGMTYDEVVDIMGYQGKLVKKDRYLWGSDEQFIMISFVDDKVMLATQNGLK